MFLVRVESVFVCFQVRHAFASLWSAKSPRAALPLPSCEVPIRPQRRELALQDRKLLTEEPRGATLHESYRPMYAQLWITFTEQMDLIWHDLSAEHFCLMFLTDFRNDLLQAFCYAFHEHLAPILGTPDHVILTRVVDVPVRFVCFCTHENSIHYQAI